MRLSGLHRIAIVVLAIWVSVFVYQFAGVAGDRSEVINTAALSLGKAGLFLCAVAIVAMAAAWVKNGFADPTHAQ